MQERASAVAVFFERSVGAHVGFAQASKTVCYGLVGTHIR